MSVARVETVAVSKRQGGSRFGDHRVRTRPIVPVLSRGVCTIFREPKDLKTYVKLNNRGKILVQSEYGRYGNPTVADTAFQLLHLEATGSIASDHELNSFKYRSPIFREYSTALLSDGMSAIDCIFDGILLRHHDVKKRHDAIKNPAHIIIGKECYKQTRNLCDDVLKPAGVEVTVIETDAYRDLEKYLKPHTRLVFVELPTNPFLRVPDLGHVIQVGRGADVPIVLDATFASPKNLQLFKLGLVPDVTIHSATKYLNGHNDVQAGFVWGRRELMLGIDQAKGRRGGQLSPDAAYNLFRGLRTYNLRIAQHNKNALEVANALVKNPFIERVWYPHEVSHPDYDNAQRLLTGGGGVVSFKVKTPRKRFTAADVDYFLSHLRCFDVSASFGGTSGMVQRVLPTSYSTMAEEQRQSLGITENLVRMSVGTERDAHEYVGDINQALVAMAKRIKARGKK